MKTLRFPLAKVALFFCMGLWISRYFSITSFYFFPTTLVLLGVLYFYHHQKRKLAFAVSTALTCITFGFLINSVHTESLYSNHFTRHLPDHNPKIQGIFVIKERLKSSTSSKRYIAEIQSIESHSCFGKVVLTIRQKTEKNNLKEGSVVFVDGTFYLNTKPRNPFQFDYGNYLQNKEIYATVFADSSHIYKQKHTVSTIRTWAAGIRNTISDVYQKSGIPNSELQFINALLLGQQQDLNPDIVKDYQLAGAVHILSVSGLHVGLVMVFTNRILKPFPNKGKGKFIKLLLSLAVLWLFGIVAGLAPSVVRSVTMFSFVALGIYLKRSVNFYHTLLVSALLILFVSPEFLFDVGFQLSYLALFFIVWLHPILSAVWKPKNRVAIYFWEIITVSVAAQLGTLPLSLYYFHQFPGLFFVTNLVVLPLVGVIMFLALFALVWSLSGSIPFWITTLLTALIRGMNGIIGKIASYETFVLQDIPMTKFMLICLYLFIICSVLFCKKPRFAQLIGATVWLLAFQTLLLQDTIASASSSEMIVFHCPKKTVITQKNGLSLTVITDASELPTDVITPYQTGMHCSTKAKEKLKNRYYFKHRKILVIDSTQRNWSALKPDILIVTGSPKLNMERLLRSCRPKIVVVDGSNSNTLRKRWKTSCEKLKIPFHDTREKGFYSI